MPAALSRLCPIAPSGRERLVSVFSLRVFRQLQYYMRSPGPCGLIVFQGAFCL
jgi:hypothetical protein